MTEAHHLDLGTVLMALHESEINGVIDRFYDGAWTVRLGDAMNGYDAEAIVADLDEAAHRLRDNAIRLYPDSTFTRRFEFW
jgi:hypothetical protein